MKLYVELEEDSQILNDLPKQRWQRRAEREFAERQRMKKSSKNLSEVYQNSILKGIKKYLEKARAVSRNELIR